MNRFICPLFLLPSLMLVVGCGASEGPSIDVTLEVATSAQSRARTTTDPQGQARPVVPIGEPVWETDIDFAVTRAKAEHRPVLIDFSASWCAPCHQLKKVTFVDPAFKAEAGRFILVNVDVSDSDDPAVIALEDKWRVTGLPLLLLLDTNGAEVERISDYVDAARLAPKLAAVP